MGEFDLIAEISRTLTPASRRTLVGLGDDAAVLSMPSSPALLLCSDMMTEGTHFDLRWSSPRDLGFKSVAACLSDIAAMGGRPLAAVISLGLPPNLASASFIKEFYRGVEDLRAWISRLNLTVDLVGGDLAKSAQLTIDVAATGEAERPILRSGAKPGDAVAVSGPLGASAAGLFILQSSEERDEALLEKHFRPLPRFDLLSSLAKASSLIDVSDGLASEAHHLAKSSGVHIALNENQLPINPRVHARFPNEAKNWALFGGEDYELLATFPPGEVAPGFTEIGSVEAGPPGLTLVISKGQREAISPSGFDHFR